MTKTLKYYLFVLGCQMNISDAERLSRVLEDLGYEKTEHEEEANLIGVVACSVRKQAVDRIFGKVPTWDKWRKKKPLITLLSGCVLPADREQLKEHFDIFIEIKNITELPEILKKSFIQLESNLITNSDYFKIPPKRVSGWQANIPISFGCNRMCTYCAVPYTRGREVNRSGDEILKEVKEVAAAGFKELTLLGQTVNSWVNPDERSEIKNFAQLLKETAESAPKMWIRFFSPYPLQFTDELIEVIATHDNISKAIHLPVQSGSDKILTKMARKYTRAQYLDVIDRIKKRIPEGVLTTDVIVGFCDETEKDFAETVSLFKACNFEMAYFGQYSPRPGTVAARVWKDEISKEEKVRRETVLNDILSATGLEKNKKYIGQTLPIIITEIQNNLILGKTQNFKTVKLSKAELKIGDMIKIKIIDAENFGLIGNLE